MLTDDAFGLGDLSRILLSEEDLESVLLKVAQVTERMIPGSDAVSITLVRDGRPETAASTAPLALEVDEIQYGADEGPCLDASREHGIRIVDDMAADPRWPKYAPHAAERGVRSSLSVPLPLRERVLGAINIYSRTPRSFDAEDADTATALASQAAVALANADLYARTAMLAEQLRTALESRAVIEQAKGILMARRGCSADEAFDELRRTSQLRNVKLRDVASRLVAETAPDAASSGEAAG